MKFLSRLTTVVIMAVMAIYVPQSCAASEPEKEPEQEQVDPENPVDPETPEEPEDPEEPEKPEDPEEPVDDGKMTFSVVSASSWKEGDRIIIQDHVNVFDVALDPGSISADGKTATVTVEGLNPEGGYDGHYHAMFPAEDWGTNNHGLYYYLYFATSNAPCAIAFDENKTFKFTGLCSSISFTVSGDYDSYCFQGADEEEVEYLSFYVKHKYADGGKYEIRELASDITAIEGTLSSSGNTVYLMNKTSFTSGYEILVGKNGEYAMKASFPSSVTMDNCKAVNLGDITSKLETYVAPVDTVSDGAYKPVMGGYTKMDVNVEEISGLCLSEDKSFLWAVGDQGLLAKVDFNGKATKVWSHDADMEDVTLDPRTGNLYIAIEGSQKIYQVNSPNFTTYSTIFYVQDAIDGGFGNSGLEGLTYYKDGQVFVGAQSGATLWLYNLDGTMIWKKRLNQISSKIQEVGGLCYDPVTNHLWVVDSEAFKIFVLDEDVTKVLASYSIPYMDNPESICVDHDRNCVWVGSDQSSPKLYKIEFTNL